MEIDEGFATIVEETITKKPSGKELKCIPTVHNGGDDLRDHETRFKIVRKNTPVVNEKT